VSAALEAIIEHGDRDRNYRTTHSDTINCADGFRVSVIAGVGCYCTPRPGLEWNGGVAEDYSGPYTEVEVGFPSARPEPWDQWREWSEDPDNPTGAVYAYVPVAAVRALVALHGGTT